jgi:pSer/pThr/pTyr-binding forkhead associated (FHA) protein
VLALRDITVSRQREEVTADGRMVHLSHALIRRDADDWIIEDTRHPERQADQRRTNPVVVNGRSISSTASVDGQSTRAYRLKGGEVITIGSTLLRFLLPGMPGAVGEDSIVEVEEDVFVGGPALASIRDRLRNASETLLNVLLRGEPGTGKEAAARWMHRLLVARYRSHLPFVPFNCPGYAETLIDGALFGVGRAGGTLVAGPGVFEKAQEGVVLLDEIGEINVSIQPKLLRALESKRIERYRGPSFDIKAWIAAATTRDLEAAQRAGTFQKQLHDRFGCEIRLPPLRERPEDVPLLVRHFLFFSEDPSLVALQNLVRRSRAPAAGPTLLMRYFQHHFCEPAAPPVLTELELHRLPVHIRALEQLCADSWGSNVRGVRDVLVEAVPRALEGGIDVLTTEVLDLPSLEDREPSIPQGSARAAPPVPPPPAAPGDALFLCEIESWPEYVRQYLAVPPVTTKRFAALRDKKAEAAPTAKDSSVRKRLNRALLVLWDFFEETSAMADGDVDIVARAFRDGLRQAIGDEGLARQLGEVLAERASAQDLFFGEKRATSTPANDQSTPASDQSTSPNDAEAKDQSTPAKAEFRFDDKTVVVTGAQWALMLAVGRALKG